MVERIADFSMGVKCKTASGTVQNDRHATTEVRDTGGVVMYSTGRVLKRWLVYPIFGPSMEDKRADLVAAIAEVEKSLKRAQKLKEESERRKMKYAATSQQKMFQMECVRYKNFDAQETRLLDTIVLLTNLCNGVEIMQIDETVTNIQEDLKPVLQRIISNSDDAQRSERLSDVMHEAIERCNERLSELSSSSGSHTSAASQAEYAKDYQAYRSAYEQAMTPASPAMEDTLAPPGCAPSSTFNY